MPAYPGIANSTVQPSSIGLNSIASGEWVWLWGTGLPFGGATGGTFLPTFETILAGAASQRVAIAVGSEAKYAPAVTAEILFSGAPGTFEVDLQEADTDADAAYITLPTGGTLTSVNANNIGRFDLIPVAGHFLRFFMKTLTNSVNVAGRIWRW